ncbi:unnamed protein product [Kluyveromyces dobzhanskii CBS 2104]|uniref:WGS project CCBQ000000000 data, contig 00102 n=1 Tax=Kluyveromyces dobzhanskii CBS 2104 TaxID=1427455 RepID=A0A0A8L739_9SACH|nr:unnamed protein product [Kluyveromyces dobzhanskii CBS 2104]
MFIALKTGHIFIIDLDDPATVHSFVLPMLINSQEKLLHVWVNPQASLILFKTNFAKYHLGHVQSIVNKSKDPKLTTLKKLNKKSFDVRTVDWSFDEFALLAGTKEGIAYYISFGSSAKSVGEDAHITKIHSATEPVDGIMFRKSLGALLIIGSQIMYWDGSITQKMDPIETFSSVKPTAVERYQQMDKECGSRFSFMGSRFAWVTQSGIVIGDFTDEKVLANAKVLLYIELPASTHRVKDVRLTKYHLILLRGSEVIVVNQLTMKVTFQECIFNSNDTEKLHSLCVDYSQDPLTVWCHSGSNVYEIVTSGEDKSVWKHLCDLHRFEEALTLNGLSPIQRDYVHSLYGDYYYEQQMWLEAATQYSKIKMLNNCGPIALKFMNDSSQVASLQLLLSNYLQGTKENYQVKQVILASWIVQNYMNQLNDIDERISREATNTDLGNSKTEIVLEFESFVTQNFNKMDRETVYQIISRQNRKKELLFFATLAQDYEYVLAYWIKLENWYESLKLLSSLQDPELIYKYSTILLISSPDATINTWMQITSLDPVPLIPSILSYFTSHQKRKAEGIYSNVQNYGANYLKWCIRDQHNTVPIVHNTYLYMMIVDKSADKDQEVMQFLSKYSKDYFDKDFILRLSLRHERYSVSICIYSEMSLYEEAVTLALNYGRLQEAKNVASTVKDPDIKRTLWLDIAAVVIKKDKDIKNTLTVLIQESENVLSVKDLLPLFDEFVTIANIKEELVRILEKHSMRITKLSQEIRDSLKIKKEIKNDIVLFKNRYENLKPGASCSYCSRPLQTRKFFVYPCGHSINTDCIIKIIMGSNEYALKMKIQNMQKKLLRDKNLVSPEELEELLSAQCPLCSEISINNIDEPWEVDEDNAVKWKI